jgi:hypothetical protein
MSLALGSQFFMIIQEVIITWVTEQEAGEVT